MILSTVADKPNFFLDLFTNEAAQALNDQFSAVTSGIKKNGYWTRFKALEKVVHLTKKDDVPLLFHSLFSAPDKPKEGELFSEKELCCIMSGFYDKVELFSITPKDVFGEVVPGDRYNTNEILEAQTVQDVEKLTPLEKNVSVEFTLKSKTLQSVAVPPAMLEKLLDCGATSAKDLTLAAILALQEAFHDSKDSKELLEAQQKEKERMENSNVSSSERIKAQLNEKIHQLAEKLGLSVVIFLLNFESANNVKLGDQNKSESVLRNALGRINTLLGGKFEINKEGGIKSTNIVELPDETEQSDIIHVPATTTGTVQESVHERPTIIEPTPPEPVNRVPLPPAPTTTASASVPPEVPGRVMNHPLSTTKKRTTDLFERPQQPTFRPFDRTSSLAPHSNDSMMNEHYYFAKARASEGMSRLDDNMSVLLFGASLDGKTVATECPLSATQIISAPDSEAVKRVILRSYAVHDHQFAKPTPAQCKDFRNCALEWREVPAGLSLFTIQNFCPISIGDDNEILKIIEAKKEYNPNSITHEEITKLTKHHSVVPTDFFGTLKAMQTQLHYFSLFFGERSKVCRSYEAFINQFTKLEMKVRSIASVEKDFHCHLLLRVDSILSEFVSSLICAVDIDQVAFLWLDEFFNILQDIVFNKFVAPATPNWIKDFATNPAAGTADQHKVNIEVDMGLKTQLSKIESELSKLQGTKNPKSNTKGERNMEKNDSVPQRLQISEDVYAKKVKNKNIDKRPSACVKFSARGRCFANCGRKNFHRKLTAAEEEEVFQYLVACGAKKAE